MRKKGAHFYLGLKGNQKTLFKKARQRLGFQKISGMGPVWESEIESGHGRIEKRTLRVIPLDEEISSFPGARQLIALTRYWTGKKTGRPRAEMRIFITSLEEGEKSPGQLAEIGRGHWSVENKNHWRRDTSRWREDRSSRRTGQGAKNLALMRGALLARIDWEE